MEINCSPQKSLDAAQTQHNPKGPKHETLETGLKFTSEPPIKALILSGILKVKIGNFKRDWSFQARLNISSEIAFSKLRALTALSESRDSERAFSGSRISHFKPLVWNMHKPLRVGLRIGPKECPNKFFFVVPKKVELQALWGVY